VVARFGAIQAQGYANVKWSLGLRMQEATDATIDDAFTGGRSCAFTSYPTWDFVTPADIRWLVELMAPRVNLANAYMYRKLEPDEALFKRSKQAFAGGHYLTRPELAAVLARVGNAASSPASSEEN
jgi:hypothetical protein